MSMKRIIMDEIPFVLDVNLLVNSLRLKDNSSAIDTVTKLAHDAMHIGRPKALYKIALAAAEQGKDLDTGEIYLCPICGNIEFGKPESNCPICGTIASKYIHL